MFNKLKKIEWLPAGKQGCQ